MSRAPLVNNFSTQLSDVEKLKRLAKRLGYVQTRGPHKGEGSVRQLLEAMIAGEVAAVRRERLRDPQAVALARLEANGTIVRARTPRVYSPFTPIKVEGEPVSEMIIRERR